MARILVPLALCAALVLAVVGPASADKEQLAPVWATVNACDPGGNQVGVRVSAPGDGSDGRIHARITLQWYSEDQGTWQAVTGSGSSPWLDVGSARVTSQQTGWTFVLDQPADGPKQLRGVAEVQWRDGETVVRSASTVTRAGAASDIGGSQAACALS
jgi:hypothetical protein